MGDRDGPEVKGLVVGDGRVAGGVGGLHTGVVVRVTHGPGSHIAIGSEVLVVADVEIIDRLAPIFITETDNASAVVLLEAVSFEFRGLAGLDDSARIGDLRGGDVIHDESGVVGGVNLVSLAHLEGELGHVVVILANAGGGAHIGDLDGEDTVLVAHELGAHGEVSGALNPRVNGNVRRDDAILVGLVKGNVVVHVVLGDSGNSLADSVTSLNSILQDGGVVFLERTERQFIILNPLRERLTFVLLHRKKNRRSPPLALGVEGVDIDGDINMGSEALDLHSVPAVNNSLGNEDEARGAAVQLDRELLLTSGDSKGVGVGVELDIDEALGKKGLLGVGHGLLAVLTNGVEHPGAGLGVRGVVVTLVALRALSAVLSVSALSTVLDLIRLAIGGGERVATRLSCDRGDTRDHKAGVDLVLQLVDRALQGRDLTTNVGHVGLQFVDVIIVVRTGYGYP